MSKAKPFRIIKRFRELINEARAADLSDPDDILQYVIEKSDRAINWEFWIPILIELIKLFLTKGAKQ